MERKYELSGTVQEELLEVPLSETELHLNASVGEGAQLCLVVRTQPGAKLSGSIQVSLYSNAHLSLTLVNLDGGEVRNRVEVRLQGEGAELELNGVYTARGDAFVGNETLVVHKVANTTSRQLFKGTVDDHATVDFGGLIKVAPDAQKVDAAQTNRHLVLSEGATANARPHLEIYADDVKCAHGATTGQLDADALFYLRQRGIPEDQARALLAEAFLREVLDRIPATLLQR